MLIITIALLSGAMVINTSVIASVNTNFRSIATQLANEKIEQIISDSYLQSNNYSYINQGNYPAETIAYGSSNSAFTRTVSIQEVASDLQTSQVSSGYKSIDVTVAWGNQTTDQQLTVSTLVTDYKE